MSELGSFGSIFVCSRHVRLGSNLGNAGCQVLPVEGIGRSLMLAMRKLPVVLICRRPVALPKTPNQPHISRRPASSRGALRGRHERWVRDAMDAAARETKCVTHS